MSTETEKTATKAVAKTKNTGVAQVKASPAERFTSKVMKEFPNGGSAELQISDYQRKLIQNYFIKLDGVLTESEVKRMAKSEQYRDALEYKWENVNMNKLAQDVIAYSSVGLDPLQKNVIHPIPYKNKKTNKFDVTFIEGFNGMELKAFKYGHDVPDNVIFELKYSNDKFKSIKKDVNNKIESYEFEVVDDFDRGTLDGGFYYKIYNDSPEKNSITVMTRSDIEKRKPAYAAAEFWGGEVDNWVNGKKQGKKQVEGWEPEMFLKSLKRHCWGSIAIDSEKIDVNYHRMIQNDSERVSEDVAREIETNANGQVVDIDHEEVKEQKTIEAPKKEAPPATEPKPGDTPKMKF